MWSAIIFKNKPFLDELLKLDFELDLQTKIKCQFEEEKETEEDEFVQMVVKQS